MAQQPVSFDRTDITFDSVNYTWDATLETLSDYIKKASSDISTNRINVSNISLKRIKSNAVSFGRSASKNIEI